MGFMIALKILIFLSFPKQFVIKATHACAFNFICLDKDQIDYKSLEKMQQVA